MSRSLGTPAAIEVRGLGVEIGKTTLLQPTDLFIKAGSWLSIIGPNGAGKSTLLKAIVGAAPSMGTVSVDGTDTASMKRTEKAQTFAWVPQTPIIPPGFRVFDYVLLGRTPHRHPLAAERSEDLAVVHDVLLDLDLAPFVDRNVDSLSGGERQRVIIARALAQQTPILLLDEPTTALDLGHQQEVLLLLDRLRDEGRTIVSTMHDLTLAGQFADRLILLACGRVVADGTTSAVLTEENLATHYKADVRVVRNNGTVLVIPRIATQFIPSSPTRNPLDHQSPRAIRNPLVHQKKETPTMVTEPPVEKAPVEDAKGYAQSIVLVMTGDGKGKSSSAFGMMCRGVARDWNVAVVQFVKSGDWNVGEEKIGRQLGVDWFNEGQGFTWNSEDLEKDKAIARAGWERAAEIIAAGEHQLVILDELTYLINWGWIEAEPVYEAIRNRPGKVSIVVTGRDAPEELIEVADTVSEVRKVKHAFDKGIVAKKGIDY